MKPATPRRERTPADTLTPQAERLWPHCPYLQREWIRAVAVVRSTKAGWVVDRRVPREATQ